MKKKLDGTFRAFEVRRTVDDVVLFLVYLAVGGAEHACGYERLWEKFRLKQRYKDLPFEDFNIMMTQVNGMRTDYWKVRAEDGVISVY